MLRYTLIISTLFLFFSCSEKNIKTESIHTEPVVNFTQMPAWASDANIYEVNTRHYTPEGTFGAFEKHLSRLQEMGVEILWFMPIHPISVKKRKAKGDLMVEDVEEDNALDKYLGSPYAVADFKAVNPDFGTDADFQHMVDAIHAAGMKIIIDWVPNHSGWDNPWITDHPEWYTKNAAGEIIDPIDPNTGESWGWTDVADLDYSNSEMRNAMLDAMLYWVETFDIDGFRVDVAHGIDQDFWDQMKDTIHSHKHLFMLAEAEVPSHRNSGAYHMNYGWSFHHLLNEIAKGEKDVSALHAWILNEKPKYEEGIFMNFTSNHDENSWSGTEFDRMGEAHKAMAVLVNTYEGMALTYSGQEEPLKKRLAFFTKDDIEFKNYAYADFYKTLNLLKKKNQAMHHGNYGGEARILFENNQVFAFHRNKGSKHLVCYLNLSPNPMNFTAEIDLEGLKEVFTGEEISLNKDAELKLEPWSYFVFEK